MKFYYDKQSKIHIRQWDARKLDFIKNESIDLVCTHPPYADIIKYSKEIIGDISLLKYPMFLKEMNKIANETFRVLKKKKICAIMMGDIRSNGNIIPLGFLAMECFLAAGFKSKEIIIKKQHNCKSTKLWNDKPNNFLLIAHEYIFVFQK